MTSGYQIPNSSYSSQSVNQEKFKRAFLKGAERLLQNPVGCYKNIQHMCHMNTLCEAGNEETAISEADMKWVCLIFKAGDPLEEQFYTKRVSVAVNSHLSNLPLITSLVILETCHLLLEGMVALG